MATAELPLWDRTERERGEDKTFDSSEIVEHGPFTARTTNGFKDICSLRVKDAEGKPGERFLIDKNYHDTCRALGLKARGKSGVKDQPSQAAAAEADIRAKAEAGAFGVPAGSN